MKVVTLSKWDEFEPALRGLDEQCHAAMQDPPAQILFRGHGDARWSLHTTLDRLFATKLPLSEYYRLALLAKPRVEAFTETRWDIPTTEEYDQWLASRDGRAFGDYKAYAYLAYLRHHGFPSPLLDWTQSPYVAAFFAFRHPAAGATHVAVHAYHEFRGQRIAVVNSGPTIHLQGPYVSSHKRHFLQQSQYTFCTEHDADGALCYTNHERVVTHQDTNRNLLWKCLLPVAERRTALFQLNRMNINAFSLFGSEDSLIETIAVSELYLRGRDM